MAVNVRNVRKSARLTNHEVVVLAVYLVGGRSRHVDTEDVAVRANEIAPGRFNWRKYKEQINIDNVRWALLDAKKTENGRYVVGTAKDGWLLTEAGVDFAESYIGNLDNMDLSGVRLDPKENAWAARERQRMLANETFRKFATGRLDEVTSQEAERFFRIDEYVVGKGRQARIQRVLNFFRRDSELGAAVEALAEKIRGR